MSAIRLVNQDQWSNTLVHHHPGARQASERRYSASSSPPSPRVAGAKCAPQAERSSEFDQQSTADSLSQQHQNHQNLMTELMNGISPRPPLGQAQSDQVQLSRSPQSSPQPTPNSYLQHRQPSMSSFGKGYSSPSLLANSRIPTNPSLLIGHQQPLFDSSSYHSVYVPTDSPVSLDLNGTPYVLRSKENKHESQLSSHHPILTPDALGITAVRHRPLHDTHALNLPISTPRTHSEQWPSSCDDDPFQADHLYNQSLLHIAVQAGHKETLLLLLLRGGIAINCRDLQGMTPLQLAVLNGQTELVLILLDHGANMNAKSHVPSSSMPNMNILLEQGP